MTTIVPTRRKNENYENGKIYAIRSSTGVYYGSTTQKLKNRFSRHMTHFRKNYKGVYCTSSIVLDGENPRIELVEAYPCSTRKELHEREGTAIRAAKERGECVVNRVIAGRTRHQHSIDNRESIRKYKREYMRVYMREYNKKRGNREKPRIECECGKTHIRNQAKRHFATKFHQAWETQYEAEASWD